MTTLFKTDSFLIDRALPKALKKWAPLFLVSSLSLFIELAVIRWISGEVRLFAYFKNLPLLAAFLGLSIGFALVGKNQRYIRAFTPLLALFALMVIGFNLITADKALIYPGGGEVFYWFQASRPYWLELISFLGMVVLFFLIIMLLFIPLGQMVGEEMAVKSPIQAYIVNILASLVGVWIFTFISYLATPPILWFILAALGFFAYYVMKYKASVAMVALLGFTLLVIALSDRRAYWSAYNRLDLSELTLPGQNGSTVQLGYNLNVQQVFYQTGINLSDRFLKQVNNAYMNDMARGYNLPYRLVAPGSNVLVVGSGMGNDVAAALRNNMGQVVSVEIDKAIIDFGQEYHPEQPYSDPRVSVVVDDARSYFNKSHEKFDLVVFGLLDSHSLLSSMSSVRLDSFVYTLQSFQQVKSLLKDGGVATVTYAASDNWIAEKLGRMLSSVFGAEKIYYFHGVMGTTFVAGQPGKDMVAQNGLQPWKPDASYGSLPLSTDDWPYLYMHFKKIPAAYWQSLLLIGILCLGLMLRSFPDALKPLWHFWFLGAAFLLIEFKSITELALLFGTTWLVNSLAISGVLCMALIANLLVLRLKKVDLRLVYPLLFISLLVSLLFPIQRLAGLDPVLRGLTSTVLLTLPLLFAGIIFSESLRRYGETSRPLASNFSGSAAGGMLEYLSIPWGIKSLYLLAIGLYFAAMLASRAKKS